jgi:hypothetical protein
MRFRLYSCWHDLPAGYAGLFAGAGAADFCLGRAWFEALAATILEEDERLCIAAIEADPPGASPRACLVGRHRERDPAFWGARSFSSLSNYYTLNYAPLADGGDVATALVELALGLRARRPRYDLLHFEPLVPGTALFDDLAAALDAAGLVTRRYFRFGNWHEDTQGLSFQSYLARRPSTLRHTLRQKSSRLARAGAVRTAVVRERAALDPAMDRYEDVYAASWKRLERHPTFIRRLAGDLADAGALRLGFLWLDHRPIAAQIWIVWQRRAVLYKLAHDRSFDALSPGTVLSARMLERLLDDERVTEVDLGAGDDPYKRLWASRRRERVGLVGFDPDTLRGCAGMLRHVLTQRLRPASAHQGRATWPGSEAG